MRIALWSAYAIAALCLTPSAFADDAEIDMDIPATPRVALQFTRDQLEKKWRARIQSVLDTGVVPIVDIESSLPYMKPTDMPRAALDAMDRLGVALMVVDALGVAKKADEALGVERRGSDYHWSYYLEPVINAYPDRFIAAANSGHSKSWLNDRPNRPDSYVEQLAQHMRAGDYPIMGELEFRHYESQSQCSAGHAKRDIDVPIDGGDGRALFRLSSETGKAFVIHLEPEDENLDRLDAMLTAFPQAKLVWAHFATLRYPRKMQGYTVARIGQLIAAHPNLHFDLATGAPGDSYSCGDMIAHGTAVIWDHQTSSVAPEWRELMAAHSDRFLTATDYGGGRTPLAAWLVDRVQNLRRIMFSLPAEAQHNVGYRNAWRLLTGRRWGEPAAASDAVIDERNSGRERGDRNERQRRQ